MSFRIVEVDDAKNPADGSRRIMAGRQPSVDPTMAAEGGDNAG
jgi:hypothetical protein